MYQTIINNTSSEVVEKKSKFIANLIYIENKADAENNIKELKKKYYDARHNCYAYRILENDNIYEKSSDDGEPSGTAGAPILNILKKNNLCNILVVVTRYFGGILLGTGGLVRAYSDSTQKALEKAQKIMIELGEEVEVKVDYSEFKNLQYYCKNNDIKILSSNYGEFITCKLEIIGNFKTKLLEDIKNKNISTKAVIELGRKYIKR